MEKSFKFRVYDKVVNWKFKNNDRLASSIGNTLKIHYSLVIKTFLKDCTRPQRSPAESFILKDLLP